MGTDEKDLTDEMTVEIRWGIHTWWFPLPAPGRFTLSWLYSIRLQFPECDIRITWKPKPLAEEELLQLSDGAVALVLDLADGCLVSRTRGGAPCIVMPNPTGSTLPRTSGQTADVFVKELLDQGVIFETTNGTCALTNTGWKHYVAEALKGSN